MPTKRPKRGRATSPTVCAIADRFLGDHTAVTLVNERAHCEMTIVLLELYYPYMDGIAKGRAKRGLEYHKARLKRMPNRGSGLRAGRRNVSTPEGKASALAQNAKLARRA